MTTKTKFKVEDEETGQHKRVPARPWHVIGLSLYPHAAYGEGSYLTAFFVALPR